jgi:hypothetical protein
MRPSNEERGQHVLRVRQVSRDLAEARIHLRQHTIRRRSLLEARKLIVPNEIQKPRARPFPNLRVSSFVPTSPGSDRMKLRRSLCQDIGQLGEMLWCEGGVATEVRALPARDERRGGGRCTRPYRAPSSHVSHKWERYSEGTIAERQLALRPN